MIKALITLVSIAILSGCSSVQTKSGEETTQLQGYSMEEFLKDKAKADQAYLDKDYQQALHLYKQLDAFARNDAIIKFRLGNIYARVNLPQHAIEAYESALLLDPSLSKAWYNMGLLQLKQSANTWAQMLTEISEDDPLYPRAEQLSKSLLEIVNGKAP